MQKATLAITSRNYGSWSLRGWLLSKFAGLDFDVDLVPPDDPAMRAELLLLSPSFLVPRVTHGEVKVWGALAIAEYLNEIKPEACLLPKDPVARARCRAISGEMMSGFANLRAAMPMNLKASYPAFKVWTGAQADVDRITSIWRENLDLSGGPFLFGATPGMADAMYAPVCTRFVTYNVALDKQCAEYCSRIMALPYMAEWIAAAKEEPDDQLEELDVEF